jgi:hypothetical protein
MGFSFVAVLSSFFHTLSFSPSANTSVLSQLCPLTTSKGQNCIKNARQTDRQQQKMTKLNSEEAFEANCMSYIESIRVAKGT